MNRKEKISRLGLALGGAALAAGIVIPNGALAADLPSATPTAYAQLLPRGLGGAVERLRKKKLPSIGGLPGVGGQSGVGGLGAIDHPALNTLIDAANSVASIAFRHEHPDQVQSYGGPADPFKDPLEVKLILRKIKECQDAAAAALQAGIPGASPVNFETKNSSLVSPTSLSDMSERVCGKYKQLAETTAGADQQRAEAGRNRFLDVLTGDRKKVFLDDSDMHKRAVKGPGGRNLVKPQDFVSTPRWYTYGHVANTYPERWYIHGWIFNGNKLVRQVDNEGFGRFPPSSAYP